MLAPQHEVVVFQQVRPHPEEAAGAAVSKDGQQYRFVIISLTFDKIMIQRVAACLT